jgi:peptidoglycan/xylan/chitin deacetylase (PgdA/CDA1 family)
LGVAVIVPSIDIVVSFALIVTAAMLAVTAILYAVPMLLRQRQVARWRRRGAGLLALTYDDGPDAITTPALLDLLDELGVRATFYLVGFRALTNRTVADRLRASSHELGTHTHSHKNAWKKGPLFEWRDMRRGYESLRETVRANAPYRPPFGKATLATVLPLRMRGRRVDWWTSASGDTRDHRPDPADVARELVLNGGPVILMHCHHSESDRREFVLRLTRELVSRGSREGVRFVTMEQLESHCA